ncbi:hypothetical protein NHX12_020376 [Muraenolepis orangiensis]|uniref:Uncharacterized protein n=1 Tax=Muraenolepis orangiensis TaxID=630683 RepID=A0A9Q0IUZ0_9TELE|nr:hypothetical protein NHX12_020376 [Muraenolepis orangiensis]
MFDKVAQWEWASCPLAAIKDRGGFLRSIADGLNQHYDLSNSLSSASHLPGRGNQTSDGTELTLQPEVPSPREALNPRPRAGPPR